MHATPNPGLCDRREEKAQMNPWTWRNRMIQIRLVLILGLALGWTSLLIPPAQGQLQTSAQVKNNSFSMRTSRPRSPTVTRTHPPTRQPSMIRPLPSTVLPTATRSAAVGIPITLSLPIETRALGKLNVSPTPTSLSVPAPSVVQTKTPIVARRAVTPTVTMIRTAIPTVPTARTLGR